MMTSYFGRMNAKAYAQHKDKGVQISASGRYWTGRTYPPLYPTWEMIRLTDKVVYEKMYREQILDKLDPLEVYNDLGEDAILLCYESIDKIDKGETFCHRHIIARWLEEELKEQYDIDVVIPELREANIGSYKFDKRKKKKLTEQIIEEWQESQQLTLFDE